MILKKMWIKVLQSCLLTILREINCHLLELKMNLYAIIPLLYPLE